MHGQQNIKKSLLFITFV